MELPRDGLYRDAVIRLTSSVFVSSDYQIKRVIGSSYGRWEDHETGHLHMTSHYQVE